MHHLLVRAINHLLQSAGAIRNHIWFECSDLIVLICYYHDHLLVRAINPWFGCSDLTHCADL
jgi:hypothetical protein